MKTKDFINLFIFLLLAPIYLSMAFFLDKTWKWWADKGNFN